MTNYINALYIHIVQIVFNIYVRLHYFFFFHAIYYQIKNSDSVKKDCPILFLPNHVSWWDGFLVRSLQQKLFPMFPFSCVMLLSELRKYPFLQKIGAMGIDPSSPSSIVKIIREVEKKRHQALLKKKGDFSFLWMGQGSIESFLKPICLKPGLKLIVKKIVPVNICYISLHIEPLQYKKPSIFIRLEFFFVPDYTEDILFESEKRLEEKRASLARDIIEYGIGLCHQQKWERLR